MNELKPLQKSHHHNALELELKQLLTALYQEHLAVQAGDVNCYAMPHLGSRNLLQKYLVSQGISNFNIDALSDENARYLLLAWRFRNQKRGVHFLRTYIKCLWGNDFEIEQLWQKKSGTYPQQLKTLDEIEENKENRNDYFLTSRLRVVLYGTSGYFSTEIAKSLNNVLPARLFVSDVSRSIIADQTLYFADAGFIEATQDLNAHDEIEIFEHGTDYEFGSQSSVHSIVTGNSQ